MLSNPIKSFLYNLFLSKPLRKTNFPLRQTIWNWINKPGTTIKTKLHGNTAVIPSGYMYPSICRTYPTFNNPLLQLCWLTLQLKKEPITVVDIGAATGDTLYLIKQNLPANSTFVYCIEPDPFLAEYLIENANAYFAETKVIKAALSSQKEFIPAWIHPLNVSNKTNDEQQIAALSFDEIWHKEINKAIDVIKIDVEGFEGNVLAGSKEILNQFGPSVIIEFHPLLIKQTNNDYFTAFDVLSATGYDKLLWFDKFGNFILHSEVNNRSIIDAMIQKSIEGGKDEDIHFDIIAPAKLLDTELKTLADCNYAKNKSYPW